MVKRDAAERWDMPREHGDGGEYVETVTLDDVRAVFDDVRGPVVLSADVSDALGCSRETARRKLATLYERGTVDRRKVSRRVVYWLVDDGRDEHGARAARADPGDDAGDGPADGDAVESGRAREESGPIDRDEWRDQLADTLAGSGDLAERRADAILKMYDHLREHGDATNDELTALVDPDAVGYQDAESLWANMVKGEDTLRALPGVAKPATGRDDPWRYDAEGES